jgi:hypothetical protein
MTKKNDATALRDLIVKFCKDERWIDRKNDF